MKIENYRQIFLTLKYKRTYIDGSKNKCGRSIKNTI